MALVTPTFCLAKHNLAHPFEAVLGFDQSMKHDRAPIQVELDPGRVGPPLLCTLSELRVKWLGAGQQSFGMVGWSITVGPPSRRPSSSVAVTLSSTVTRTLRNRNR
jgi:hypothetical protein